MLASIKKAARALMGNRLSHIGTNTRVADIDLAEAELRVVNRIASESLPVKGRVHDSVVMDDIKDVEHYVKREGKASRSVIRQARRTLRSRNTRNVKFHVKRSGNFNTCRLVNEAINDKRAQFAYNPLITSLLNKLPVYVYKNRYDHPAMSRAKSLNIVQVQ